MNTDKNTGQAGTATKVKARIAVHGAAGRMGGALVRAISERCSHARLAGAVDHADSPQQSKDAGALAGLDPLGVVIQPEIDLQAVDVVIDFSRPAGFQSALAACVEQGVAFVSGTTGLDEADFSALNDAAQTIPVLHAMNFSLGVAVLRALAEQAAHMLGSAADVEIVEAHHKHKVDAPSGTALALGESVAAGLGEPLEDVAIWTRYGDTGERAPGTVGFSVIRGGDIVGEHTAMFCMNGERVELTHRATDRMIFARGAVRAAIWLANQRPGQYAIADVLK